MKEHTACTLWQELHNCAMAAELSLSPGLTPTSNGGTSCLHQLTQPMLSGTYFLKMPSAGSTLQVTHLHTAQMLTLPPQPMPLGSCEKPCPHHSMLSLAPARTEARHRRREAEDEGQRAAVELAVLGPALRRIAAK